MDLYNVESKRCMKHSVQGNSVWSQLHATLYKAVASYNRFFNVVWNNGVQGKVVRGSDRLFRTTLSMLYEVLLYSLVFRGQLPAGCLGFFEIDDIQFRRVFRRHDPELFPDRRNKPGYVALVCQCYKTLYSCFTAFSSIFLKNKNDRINIVK